MFENNSIITEIKVNVNIFYTKLKLNNETKIAMDNHCY